MLYLPPSEASPSPKLIEEAFNKSNDVLLRLYPKAARLSKMWAQAS
jgi:hypothetical protein